MRYENEKPLTDPASKSRQDQVKDALVSRGVGKKK